MSNRKASICKSCLIKLGSHYHKFEFNKPRPYYMELDLKLTSKEINEIMWSCSKTLSTAESCTAGRISAAITAVPGSSDYFKGGLICYSDELKQNFLNVDAEIIESQTAVSEEVVKQMVYGANELFGTDIALAISGFAGPGGPDGGRSGVLVGTIWIAVGNKEKIVTRIIEEDNGRDKNLSSATSIAIHMLLDYLKETCPKEDKIEEL